MIPTQRKRSKRQIFRKILHQRVLPFVLLTCTLAALLSSCRAHKTASALAVLEAMLAVSSASTGDIYVLPDTPSHAIAQEGASQDAKRIRVATGNLLSAAFGNKQNSPSGQAISSLFSAFIDDGAMRFSTGDTPCEFVVLHSISRADTEALVELLLVRKEALSRQYRGSESSPIVEASQIAVIGKYVIFALCDDVEKAVDVAKDVISKS